MPKQVWTILDVINWTKDKFASQELNNPRLEAEVLLAKSLDMKRMSLYLQYDRPLEQVELSDFKKLIRRRLAGEPVAYITGTREFYSLNFKVDNRVLIPRPETELLVDLALEFLRAKESPTILDVGTGCGALAVTIALNAPDAEILAVDICKDTLALAGENMAEHGVQERVRLQQLDFGKEQPAGRFDLVVSNPPYIPDMQKETLMPEVRDFEPHLALFSGADGLDMIRILIDRSFGLLRADGALLMEIGFDQTAPVKALIEAADIFKAPTIHKDLAGHNRAVLAYKK